MYLLRISPPFKDTHLENMREIHRIRKTRKSAKHFTHLYSRVGTKEEMKKKYKRIIVIIIKMTIAK